MAETEIKVSVSGAEIIADELAQAFQAVNTLFSRVEMKIGAMNERILDLEKERDELKKQVIEMGQELKRYRR